ncbi:uncharacterized protein VP01_3468g2, partial [Puccinia sorghi]
KQLFSPTCPLYWPSLSFPHHPDYHSDPEESLGHLHHQQVHSVSPREDFKHLRAQLDKSLAQDATLMPDTPLLKSCDEPTMSIPDHQSPHLRAIEPYPSVALVQHCTIESPFDRYFTLITTSVSMNSHANASRPKSIGPPLSFLEFLLPRRSIWSGMLTNVSRLESIDLPPKFPDFLLPMASDMPRRSTVTCRSLAKELERDVAAACQNKLALADQRVSSQLTQQTFQDLEWWNVIAANQPDLAALAHVQPLSCQLGQQTSILQACENKMYHELDQLGHQLDLGGTWITRQRERGIDRWLTSLASATCRLYSLAITRAAQSSDTQITRCLYQSDTKKNCSLFSHHIKL